MAKSISKASSARKTPAKPRKAAVIKTNGNGKVAHMPIPHERVAELAHQFWIERGHQHGFHEEDWLRAERELRRKAS